MLETNKLKLVDLLKENYFIPNYQRKYKWDVEKVINLINTFKNDFDINDESKNKTFPNQIHLKIHNKDIEIIDGQQRLTTLNIIFLALLNIEKNNLKISNTYLNALQLDLFDVCFNKYNKFLINDEKFNDTINCLELRFITSFKQNSSQKKEFEEFLNDYKNNKFENTNYNYFYKIYLEILKYLNTFTIEEINKLKQNLFSIEFNVRYEFGKTYILYKNLNLNSDNLTIFEQIKSILLQNDRNESELQKINNIEKILNTIHSLNNEEFISYLSHFVLTEYFEYTSCLNSFNDKNIVRIFEDIVNKFSKEIILDKLHNYLKLINENMKNLDQNILKKLKIYGNTTHGFITYLYFKEKNNESRKEIVDKIIIPYFYRNFINAGEENFIDKFNIHEYKKFYSFMEKYKDKTLYDRCLCYFGNDIPNDQEINILKDSLIFKKHSNIAKVLAVLVKNNYDETSLEHIIPQKFVKNENFLSNDKNKENFPNILDFKELYQSVYHLGNFTIIEQKENSSNSDKLPSEKFKKLFSEKMGLYIDSDFLKLIENNTMSYLDVEKRGKFIFEKIKNHEYYKFDFDKFIKIKDEFEKENEKKLNDIKDLLDKYKFNREEGIKIVIKLLKDNEETGNFINSNDMVLEIKSYLYPNLYSDINNFKYKYEFEKELKEKIAKQLNWRDFYNPLIKELNNNKIFIEGYFDSLSSKDINFEQYKNNGNKYLGKYSEAKSISFRIKENN